MSVNWNLFLSRYQNTRGGLFLGSGENECSCSLLLTDGEKSPVLVCIDESYSGRSAGSRLYARTMVHLSRPYRLHIRARGIMSSGVSGVATLIGKGMDFGYPEATRGRIITTDNRAFTKLVLGDLELRNAMSLRKKDELLICPGPQENGQHLVEVTATNFAGLLNDEAPWSNEAMASAEFCYCSEEEKAALLTAGSAHFDAHMDGFLDFLRAARNAVTMWPIT